MTDQAKMTDERIMAYTDGELTRAEAMEVELAAERDETIRRKIRLFRETADQLRTAAEDLPPVPEALAERISSLIDADVAKAGSTATENVLPFRSKRWFDHLPAAIAASITLAAGLAAGMALGPFSSPQPSPPFGITALADPGLADALSVVESGSSKVLDTGATLNVIASFVDADGALCREFDYEALDGPSIVSVACRTDDSWHPKIAIAASTTQSGDFAPASSLDAIEAWLVSSGLGEPLEPQAEKRRLEMIMP